MCGFHLICEQVSLFSVATYKPTRVNTLASEKILKHKSYKQIIITMKKSIYNLRNLIFSHIV